MDGQLLIVNGDDHLGRQPERLGHLASSASALR
jgi:hypothetical protein